MKVPPRCLSIFRCLSCAPHFCLTSSHIESFASVCASSSLLSLLFFQFTDFYRFNIAHASSAAIFVCLRRLLVYSLLLLASVLIHLGVHQTYQKHNSYYAICCYYTKQPVSLSSLLSILVISSSMILFVPSIKSLPKT